MQLRDYQVEQNERVLGAYGEGARTVLSQLPTGSGKTATCAVAIKSAVAKGRRVIFAAHLDSLIEDTHRRLTGYGIPAGFVQAGRPSDPTAPVQVCSLQTLHARDYRPACDFFVLDECHRAMAGTVRRILASYPEAWILGLSATPVRGDDQPLGDEFQALIPGPQVRELQDKGHLCTVNVIAPPEPLEALICEPVDAYETHTPGTRAIVFCSSVDHAEWVAAGFNARGIPAASVTGETPRAEREGVRAALTDGTLKVLTSVNVFTEGWDCPAVETVILAREFSFVGPYLQGIGRGLRPSPATGKTHCTVLDLRGSSLTNGLPDEDRIWSLDGKPRRTEKLPSLRRCHKCQAIYRPTAKCPRCGAALGHSTILPRILTRAEKLALQEKKPQAERDAGYFHSLMNVAQRRMRMQPARARKWASDQFRRKFGRDYTGGK
jgi:DNA repair protein RadD